MKHTAGTWTYKTHEGWPCVEFADKRSVAVEGKNFEEAIANAKLIAAAPALLEALESCVNKLALWPEGMNPEFFPCMKAARAIIQQVKGSEP